MCTIMHMLKRIEPPGRMNSDYDKSERDRLLVMHWRSLWQQHREAVGAAGAGDGDAFTVNTRHQCMLRQPCEVVRPFVCAPHFYGCLQCGQEHLCYRDSRRCISLVSKSDGATLTCQYSGQVLDERAAPKSFVGTHSEQKIADDNARHPLARYLADGERGGNEYDEAHQSRGRFRQRRGCYTNSRITLHRRSREVTTITTTEQASAPLLPVEKAVLKSALKKHREKAHPMMQPVVSGGGAKRKRKRVIEEQDEDSGGDGDEGKAEAEAEADDAAADEEVQLQDMLDEIVEEEEDGEGQHLASYWDDHYDDYDDSVGAYGARDSVRSEQAYWDDYYRFLDSVPPYVADIGCNQVEEMDVMVTPMASSESYSWWWWCAPAPPSGSLVSAVQQLVEQLLRLQTRDAVARELVARVSSYYVARVSAVQHLLARVAGTTTASSSVSRLTDDQLCATLLLRLFGETYWAEDGLGNRIAIWHACPWYAQLEESGVIAVVYGERSSWAIADDMEDGPRKRPKMATLTRKRIEQWATLVKRALSEHYAGQPQWLRQVILGAFGKLNTDASHQSQHRRRKWTSFDAEAYDTEQEDDDEAAPSLLLEG